MPQKTNESNKVTYVLIVTGVLLIVAAIALIILQGIRQRDAVESSSQIVSKMYELMPEIKIGSSDDRVNMSMPVLEIDGEDFAGIIEIPLYNAELPISADGGSDQSYRVVGSLYDGSLVIGGASHAGQFDFMKSITETDEVFITDVMGYRFAFEVSEIIVSDEISPEGLADDTADLVLFAKDAYSSKYTIVKCKR